MRVLVENEQHEQGDDPDQLRDELQEDLEVENEVEPQGLGELNLGMEVRTDAAGDGPGMAG